MDSKVGRESESFRLCLGCVPGVGFCGTAVLPLRMQSPGAWLGWWQTQGSSFQLPVQLCWWPGLPPPMSQIFLGPPWGSTFANISSFVTINLLLPLHLFACFVLHVSKKEEVCRSGVRVLFPPVKGEALGSGQVTVQLTAQLTAWRVAPHRAQSSGLFRVSHETQVHEGGSQKA